MQLNLREHQSAVIDALREGFKQGYRSQLLYAPTGFGKTEVAIALMQATADKSKKAAILLDRLVLVDQTSLRLSKYGLDHGVYQSEHWKFDRNQKLQVCSAQTLEARDDFPKVDLLIVDECHISRKQTTAYIKANPDLKVIGLTATPFTKGLGSIYQNVVCGATNGWLVDNKWLTPLKVYIAKEIDMTGVKKVAGEWSQEMATKRGMQITGDIVSEWITKTHEVFGGPRKTIVFCAGVAHGADLVQQFAERGYNFVSISYKDDDDFKREAIEDFAKPDTTIHGLIATDILTRGFDVSDVMIGVSARPFSKSLSSHVQQMGRVMRSHDGKEFALWLCMARGSRVLTNKGLVPIEKVSLSHKIWDGTNFVKHGGAVCNGIQKVITYQGLTATPGHLVHTAQGWRTFGDCAREQIAITQTGLGEQAIRVGEGYFSRRSMAWLEESPVHSCGVRVREVWASCRHFIEQFGRRKNAWLSLLQPASPCLSDVALCASAGDACAMPQPQRRELSALWRDGRGVPLRGSQGWHALDHGKHRHPDEPRRDATGSGEPERALRAGEYPVADGAAQPTEQARQSSRRANAQATVGTPRNPLLGQHSQTPVLEWHDGRGNHREIPPPLIETKREVWDILDAGPLNRFTCEGLLVHNCHSGNYLRFRDDWDNLYVDGVDTLDKTVEKPKKELTPEEKTASKCPSCGHLWPKGMDTCPSCGHVRERRNQVESVSGILEELAGGKKPATDDRQSFYSELLHFAGQKNYQPGWAKHKYKEKFGVWPKNLAEIPVPVTEKTARWIRSKNIAWSRTQNRVQRPLL